MERTGGQAAFEAYAYVMGNHAIPIGWERLDAGIREAWEAAAIAAATHALEREIARLSATRTLPPGPKPL